MHPPAQSTLLPRFGPNLDRVLMHAQLMCLHILSNAPVPLRVMIEQQKGIYVSRLNEHIMSFLIASSKSYLAFLLGNDRDRRAVANVTFRVID
jgi:hypothetical protein